MNTELQPINSTQSPRRRWQQIAREHLVPIVLLWLVLRGGLLVAGYTARHGLLPRLGPNERSVVRTPDRVALDIWDRWDSFYYIEIATTGYSDQPNPNGYYNAAFFPLYPLLIRLLTPLFGNPVVAGVALSNAALLAATLLLYRLALDAGAGDREFARRAVVYLLIFPTSFYLGAIYTEALFLLLTLGSFSAGLRGRWLLAGGLGALAAATRSQGVVMYGVLLLLWLATWDNRHVQALIGGRAGVRLTPPLAPPRARPLLAIQLVPLGLLAFWLWLYWRFGNPTLFFDAQAAWQRGGMRFPLVTLWGDLPAQWARWLTAGEFGAWRALGDVLAGTLGLAAALPVWRRFGLPAAALLLGSLTLPLLTGSTLSLMRFTAVLFPLCLLLAWAGRRPLLHQSLVALCALLLATLFGLFANVVFVG